jgi:hypothetical protein
MAADSMKHSVREKYATPLPENAVDVAEGGCGTGRGELRLVQRWWLACP